MNYIFLILVGVVSICSVHASAESSVEPAEIASLPEEPVLIPDAIPGVNDDLSQVGKLTITTDLPTIGDPAVLDDSPQVGDLPVAADQPKGGVQRVKLKPRRGKKSKGNRSVFNRFKVQESPVRSCQEALDKSLNNKCGILDLGYTSDFSQNGWAAIQAYIAKFKETNGFGTHSKIMSIDLTKSNATPEVISLLLEQAKNGEFTIVLNLAYNKSLGDELFDIIDSFQNIYAIILRGTNISDVSIAKINTLLETVGAGALCSVDVSDTNISRDGVKSLEEQLLKATEIWNQQNPSSPRELEGTGVVYEQIAKVKSAKVKRMPKRARPVPNLSLKPDSEISIPNLSPELEPEAVVSEPDIVENLPVLEANDQIESVDSAVTNPVPADPEIDIMSDPAVVAAMAPVEEQAPELLPSDAASAEDALPVASE
ncbi:MAG: hypothetical protein LBE97_02530 [Holosporales bacterium]|nr:hypothetical protein [Holosporales bacterium]